MKSYSPILLLAVASCSRQPPAESSSDLVNYQMRSKATEAQLQFNMLGKTAKSIVQDTGSFPVGNIGWTPSTPCCTLSPDGKCPPDPAAYADPLWKVLEFDGVGAHYFRYSYSGTEKEFVAKAEADLDCDGTSITFTLQGSIDAGGTPQVKLTEPAQLD